MVRASVEAIGFCFCFLFSFSGCVDSSNCVVFSILIIYSRVNYNDSRNSVTMMLESQQKKVAQFEGTSAVTSYNCWINCRLQQCCIILLLYSRSIHFTQLFGHRFFFFRGMETGRKEDKSKRCSPIVQLFPMLRALVQLWICSDSERRGGSHVPVAIEKRPVF